MVHRSDDDSPSSGKNKQKERRMSHVIVKKGAWDRMEDPATKRIFYNNSLSG
jgi:hypothetical protein